MFGSGDGGRSKMNAMSVKEAARNQMNQWGREGRPFFFLVDFQMRQPVVLPLESLPEQKIRCALPHFQTPEKSLASLGKPFRLTHGGYSKKSYESQFRNVVSEIRAGNSFLVNLTCETPVQLSVGLPELYERVHAKYKLLYRDQFLVFSPETFVQIHDGIISSCPMKGTMDALLPDAERTLLENPKEKAEHSTIVDLIRNDLSIVATNVRVERFRYVETLETDRGKLLQVSSEITGKLPADYASCIGDILFDLLPAGSITGAPKQKTVEIILETETYERGYYTGIFGIFDGRDLDSAVLIRFLEQTERGLVYKSGGGITAFSQLDDEYEEMLQKIYVPIH
jgi:para-aminobenzoate synthetase component I